MDAVEQLREARTIAEIAYRPGHWRRIAYRIDLAAATRRLGLPDEVTLTTGELDELAAELGSGNDRVREGRRLIESRPADR